MFDYFLTQMFIWTNKTVYFHKIKNNHLAIHIHTHTQIHIWINVVKWMHPHLDFAQIMFSSETRAPQDTDLAWTSRGHMVWPLGSSQQQAHRVAGRLMHTTHTHTHNDMTSDMSESSSMCTYGWLEGKSSCRLSMNSNKRTIENNKTASHSGSSRKKSFPLLVMATSQCRAIQTPDPLSGAKQVLRGFTALWREDHWLQVSEYQHPTLAS